MDKKGRPLSVEIPTTTYRSHEPASSPSPIGILDPRPRAFGSVSSLPQLGVKFAPLPKPAPRKRRSHIPLGVAARSELMRRRREYMNGGANMWTDEELVDHQIVLTEEEKRRREEEDPFVVLGKMVKVASMQLWRKMSQKEQKGKTKNKETTTVSPVSDSKLNKEESESISVAGGHVEPPTSEPRPALATISPNGEGQPAHSDDHFSNVSQTETIVEGHPKHSWVAEKRESTLAAG